MFLLDPLANQVTTEACPACKQADEWDYCTPGRHVHCHACQPSTPCTHAGCEIAMCAEHLGQCSECGGAICPDHRHTCEYCHGDQRFCQAHIQRSYEGKYICSTCANMCRQCGNLYPPDRVRHCSVCNELFCTSHLKTCPSCNRPYCADHGAQARGHADGFCSACVERCDRCPPDRRYLKADLARCKVCQSVLCTDHGSRCVGCGQVICDDHSLATAQGKGCAECFAECVTCGENKARSEMAVCHLCPPGDTALHCKTHAPACPECGRSTCGAHSVVLKNGRTVCSACAARCTVCASLFTRQELVPCAECGQVACVEDRRPSEFRDEMYCRRHSLFVECVGCGREGPPEQLVPCPVCGLSYCPHCGVSGQCGYCANPSAMTPDAWRFLQVCAPQLAALAGPDKACRTELLEAIRPHNLAYVLAFSQSRSHFIFRGQYKGGMFGFVSRWLRAVKAFTLVAAKRDGTISTLRVH